MTPPSKLTPKETSQELGVHPQTVYDLVKTGRLPARKIGRRVVIDRADLERYLAETVVSPAPRSVVNEDPKTGSWFLVWKEHGSKRTVWLTPQEVSALPQALVLKLPLAEFTTPSTGSRG